MGGFFSGAKKFLFGQKGKVKNVSTLRPEQEGLYQQAVNSGMQPGAGGAFGEAADYYRSLLDPNGAAFNEFAAPALRQYNEEIVPGLSEQFAGMGSGGLSSSGFRNAQIQGATDLSERLGALRANLRQAGAQGLQNIGQIGLQNYSQNMQTRAPTEGLLSSAASGLAKAGTSWLSNQFGANTGGDGIQVGGISSGSPGPLPNSSFSANSFGQNRVGANSSPYGNANNQASPNIGQYGYTSKTRF